MTIGLVGVGTMGLLATDLLLKAGEAVLVTDVNRDALAKAQSLGAQIGHTPADVATQANIILLLLPGPVQIETVMTGPNGLLSATRAGQVIVDMSTVDPNTTRRMGQFALEQSVHYLDAPILGRPSAVGNWVLPVGGDAATMDSILPILSILAREVIHVGPLGAGNTLKLLNAMMFSAINVMTAEMMAVSRKAGLDPQIVFDTIAGSAAATVSGLFVEVGGKIIARDFQPAFSVELLCKDNGLAISMAEQVDAPPIIARAVQTMNELARAQGLGAEDTSALVKVYENLLDVPDQ